MSDVAIRTDAEHATAATRVRATMLAFATDAETEAVLRDALTAELANGVNVRRGGLEEAARTLKRNPSPLARKDMRLEPLQ
jgi:plasmid stability protein